MLYYCIFLKDICFNPGKSHESHDISIYGGFQSHGGSLIDHPFLDRIVPPKKKTSSSDLGDPP